MLLSTPLRCPPAMPSLSLLGDDVTADLRALTLEFIDQVFTKEAAELRSTVDSLFDQNQVGLFSVSILFTLATVSRGFAVLIRALDVD